MTAAKKYAEHQKDIAALLKLTKGKLTAHRKEAARDPKNWGYAGDLSYVQGQLTEVLAFLMNADAKEVEPLIAKARKAGKE